MKEMETPEPSGNNARYESLRGFLHAVRWTQHLLAIIAEVLILVSFAMSGMDVSLGGVMASIPLLKILWAAMFALGIDTAFALSWVRVRQCVNNRQWGPLAWNLLLALSMSFIIFQPIAVQLLQQTLNISFNQAVTSLGINIVLLTYARSAVAIFLGAILAMTNVEHEAQAAPTNTLPKRQFIRVEQLFRKAELEAPAELPDMPEASVTEQVVALVPPAQPSAQREQTRYDTPEQREQKVSETDLTGLSARERVAKVLEQFPDLSDRELGKLSSTAAATAKKHKEALQRELPAEHAVKHDERADDVS